MKRLLISRWLHFAVLLSLLYVIVFIVPQEAPFRQRIQFLTFDYYLTNHKRVPDQQVRIVDFDDKSLAKVAQWPWPRTTIAQMVNNLTEMGAKSIAFDGVLAEPDRTSPALWPEYADTPELKEALGSIAVDLRDNDKILAEAIKNSGRFVAGFSFGSNSEPPRIAQAIGASAQIKAEFVKKSRLFKTSAQFLPELENASAGNGSFMASAEIDGVIRRTPLVFSDGEKLYPSLGLEALRVSFDQRPIIKLGVNKNFSGNKVDTEYRLLLGPYEVPLDVKGDMWLHFRDFSRSTDYIPAYKLLDERYSDEIRKEIEGRIVLIGSSAEGLLDLRSTPLGLLPGVEIHANAIEQIVQGQYLLRPQIVKDAENNFILVVGLLLILLAPFIGASWLALICFSLTGAIFYLSFVAFNENGILVDPIYPVIAAILIYVFSSILTYIRTEAERKQVREAFGLYISPAFMDELTKNPEKLQLGGETRELTVMFTDIRNFTSIAESMTPEELIQLMNEFLTPMSDLVMNNRGTIDKYMGDAMMAFWNAPLDVPDHARHACTAALSMNKALVPINAELCKRAEEKERLPVTLKAGIGIHTGQASVGNMGSKQRFAYSAIGDTVNLASRLEGQTKFYSTSILISEDTQRRVSDFATLEADLLQVQGKQEPVRVFALLGDVAYAQSGNFAEWQAVHNRMIVAYRQREFALAEELIAECRTLAADRLSDFYQLYKERIKTLKQENLPASWDGVYVATSK